MDSLPYELECNILFLTTPFCCVTRYVCRRWRELLPISAAALQLCWIQLIRIVGPRSTLWKWIQNLAPADHLIMLAILSSREDLLTMMKPERPFAKLERFTAAFYVTEDTMRFMHTYGGGQPGSGTARTNGMLWLRGMWAELGEDRVMNMIISPDDRERARAILDRVEVQELLPHARSAKRFAAIWRCFVWQEPIAYRRRIRDAYDVYTRAEK